MKSYPLLRYLPLSLLLTCLLAGCRTSVPSPSRSTAYFGLTQSMHQWRLPHGHWKEVGQVSLKETDDKAFQLEGGKGVFLNHPSGGTSNLTSHVQHGDVSMHVEFNVPKGSNSGVYLQGRYEVQVLDSWGKAEVQHSDCGGIYQRWIDQQGVEGRAPRINASLPPGAWQSFDIVFRAPRFDETGGKTENARFLKVIHNGVVIHENIQLSGPTRAASFNDEQAMGPLMLQGDHGPVAFRNILIRPLSLD
ncbi:MAG: DUF1080 domain-containing protein [Verrucomicrobiota bacterium]|jgi:hypothetical protein|nr:DUF1080 domain-containing protein [Verrucomicrobiota bacterium]